MGRAGRNVIAIALLPLVVAACSGAAGSVESTGSTGSSIAPGATSAPEPTSAPSATPTADSSGCGPAEGLPLQPTASVSVEEYGELGGVRVSGAVYPRPDYEGNPWSQWGQGYVLEDGRFFSAIGDHQGVDGNSFIYEYDPQTNQLTQVGDVLSYVDHVPGTWGYGKIHSQMVPGPCDEIYFSTYWGSYRDIEFEGNYSGDILFRLDPFARTLAPLGVPVEFHGQASLAADVARGLVYGEAIDPVLKNDDIDRGPFFAFDVASEKVVYTGPDEPHVEFRSILVDQDGGGYYSVGGGGLVRYDPVTGETTPHPFQLPGNSLRAVTGVAPDGSVFGVTSDPDQLFVMDASGEFRDLGPTVGYTASVAAAPDGSEFYYMPGAHGDSANWGSPLISVDPNTGEQTTLVELNELVEQATGYTVGGTYNVAVSPDGSRIFVGANVGEAGTDSTFGEVMLLIVDLP